MLFTPIFASIALEFFIVISASFPSNDKTIITLNTKESGLESIKMKNEQLIPKSSKCDPEQRLEEIHNSINESYQSNEPLDHHKIFSIDISKLIKDYESNKSLEHLYNKVMDKLNISKEEKRSKLDFYNDNFAKEFHSILLARNVKFTEYDSFRHDIVKLAFKWLIYMKQKTVGKNEKFKQVSLNVQLIASIVYEEENLELPFNFRLESMSDFTFRTFKDLIESEFFENPSIFPLFASSIEYFYLKNGNLESEVACEGLKSKYFHGDYDNYILLKYLIVLYDPQGRMRACIPYSDSHSSLLFPFPPIPITIEYLDNVRLRGPENLEIYDMEFVSKFMVQFFLSVDKKFRVLFDFDLVYLLQKIKEANLLKKEILERIIEFGVPEEKLGWNTTEYKDLLKEYMEDSDIPKSSPNEIDEYCRLFD